MSGLGWRITIQVSCETCGDRRLRTTQFSSPYKGMLVEEECDELRMDFLMDLQTFDQWEVRDLETWDAVGKFYCRECVKREHAALAPNKG